LRRGLEVSNGEQSRHGGLYEHASDKRYTAAHEHAGDDHDHYDDDHSAYRQRAVGDRPRSHRARRRNRN
jgi:hypothetical protein